MRLAGSGSPHEGRLEVYNNGEWGTVCDDLFDDVDATVACNSLGFRLINYFAVFVQLISLSVIINVNFNVWLLFMKYECVRLACHSALW